MLIEVHHGDACVLLVNGNCRVNPFLFVLFNKKKQSCF